MIRVILDDSMIYIPDKWKDLSSKLKREDDYNAVLLYQETTLEFYDQAYNYLYNKLLEEGYCSVSKIEVQESCDEGKTWDRLLIGKIFISDIKFNEKNCQASVKIEDQSFYAMIKNNSKIKTVVDAGKTKNSESIAIPIDYLVDFWDVATNASIIKTDIYCYRVYDLFKYLIGFMSDNRVGFASNLFDYGGKWQGLAISSGKRLRTNNKDKMIQISFNDLFNEVKNVTEQLVMILEDPYGSPVIRIEDQSYSLDSAILMTLDDVYEIQTSVDSDIIYTNVKVGTGTLNDDNALPFPEQIDYFGFKDEQVFLQGECNIDRDLDLSGSFVRSNNVIEDIIYLGSDSYDNDIFIIETIVESTNNGRTTNTNYFDVTPAVYYYNIGLTNSNILDRYIGGLPNNVAQYTGAIGDGLFYAYSSAALFTGPPTNDYLITNASVSQNVGGYYNTGTSRYTAPVTGIYSFGVYFEMYNINWNICCGPIDFRVIIRYYDSSGFAKDTYLGPMQTANPGVTTSLFWSFQRTQKMNAGDYAEVRMEADGGLNGIINYDYSSHFTCYDNTVGGGVMEYIDPKSYPILLHEFEYPLSNAQFCNIVQNPLSKIQFKMNQQVYRTGWIKEIKYQHISKKASIKLFTSQNAN